MTAVGKILLVAGLFFPVISWVTVVLSVFSRWKSDRHASPIFIPLIGPLLLTCWIFGENYSYWLIPVVWMSDIGTVAFIAVLPWLIGEYWNTSRFTCLMTLRGATGIEKAVITLHSTGHYHLEKSWDRAQNESGISSLGESGKFTRDGNDLELQAHDGLRRRLVYTDAATYRVEEYGETQDDSKAQSLQGWHLSVEM